MYASEKGDNSSPLVGGLRRSSAGTIRSRRQQLAVYMPIFDWLPAYSFQEFFVKDVACAITLACVLIGQSLAHAALSGVGVIHGPYSCMLPPLIYALFGSCLQGSVGTGGLLALLTGSALQDMGDEKNRDHAAGILCLLIGLMMALMGFFQLSFLVRFLSRPALSGFITGSAFLIIKAMLLPMLGLPLDVRFSNIIDNPQLLDQCNPVTVALSTVGFLFLYFAKAMLPKKLKDLKDLMVLVGSGTFCFFFGSKFGVELVGNIPSGLPSVQSPIHSFHHIHMTQKLAPQAVLIALVCFISSFASAKKCGMKGGYQVIAFNELMALGLANIGGSFTGAVPTQIGLSRSALAFDMGVNSPLGANLFVAFFIVAIMQVFAPALAFAPRCILNSIICNAAIGLFEFGHAKGLWMYGRKINKWGDFFIWNVAFWGTLGFGAFKGIVFAVAISLAMAIRELVNPRLDILGKVNSPQGAAPASRWVNMKKSPEAKQVPGILVLRLDGPLFYANSERFQDKVSELELKAATKGQPIGAIILSAASMPFADSTAMEVLEAMIISFKARNVQFYISGAYGPSQAFISHALGKLLGTAEIQNRENADLSLSIDGCIEVAQRKMRGEMPKLSSKRRVASSHELHKRVSSHTDLPHLNM